jgi:hypothetical protein
MVERPMNTKPSNDVETSSGNLVATKHIGSQLTAGDASVGDMLDSWPPLGVEKNLVGQPVGNRLLLDGGAPQECGDTVSQLRLASGQVDRPLERVDVRGNGVVSFFHEHRKYKPSCAVVNKAACVTTDKAACIVLPVSTRGRQSQPRRAAIKPERELRIGADGRTAAARFSEAFAEWRQRAGGTQESLALEASKRMGYNEADSTSARLAQQEISQFLAGDNDLANSAKAGVIAEVIGVRPGWLQFGVLPKHGLTPSQLEALRSLGLPA